MTEPQKTPLALAINALSERRIAAQRTAMAYGGGFNTGIDSKRSTAWASYGYPNTLNFWDYLNVYERNSLAHAIVNRIAEKTWQDDPWLIEGDETDESRPETRWERDTRKLFKRLNVWQKFKEADIRRMVGSYSGLILQVADNGDWDTELQSGRLINVIPAWEGQLLPSAWNNDVQSPDYGMPTMWTYQEAQIQTADHPPPGRSVSIHHSRVVIVGDYREGVPLLKAAYNNLVSLEKIEGALGESYWKNAARQLSIEFDKDAQIATLEQAARESGYENLNQAMNESLADLNEGLDASTVTMGGKVTTLTAQVPPPKEPADVLRQNICAAVRYPTRAVVGNETGERASEQDEINANNRCQQRRVSEINTDIRRMIDRLMEYRIIDQVAEYEVMWSELGEASTSEKLANMLQAAKIVKELMGTGMLGLEESEIRSYGGHLPLEEPVTPPDVDEGEGDE